MAQEVALVTGASSGIGEALARRIAPDGRHLVLVARRAERLQALARALEHAHEVTAHVIARDPVKPAAARELLDDVSRRGPTVPWLVNNPGVAWMSAEQVADQAVRGVGRGPVLVNGTMNSLMTGALRFVPRAMVSRAVSLFLRPKEA